MTIDISTITSVASLIVVIGGAVGVLLKLKSAMVEPLDDINKKIAAHEEYLAKDKQKLEDIEKILDDLIESMAVMMRSQRTILRHLEEGNNTGQIKERSKELDDWLIERKESQWKNEL